MNAAPRELKVEIAAVIDRSGSMAGKKNDVIGGFNSFLDEQQKVPGEARMSVVLFNTTVRRIHASVPIKDVMPLSGQIYRTSGCTALLDAVGSTIRLVEDEVAARPADQQPDKIVLVIATDGEENSSKEYKLDQLRQMIEERQNSRRWEFIFMGANIDAFGVAGAMGINAANTSNFKASGRGIRSAMLGTSERVFGFRSGASADDLGQFDANKTPDDEDGS